MRRRPKWSPSEPPSSKSAARKSAYASTTHWTSMAVALRLACSAGSATLTTVPSMKTMLDPRIVAARIQRRRDLVHGVAPLFAEMTPSSQGGRRMFIELRRHRLACVSKVEQESAHEVVAWFGCRVFPRFRKGDPRNHTKRLNNYFHFVCFRGSS